jgi:hypothetical protein
MWSLDPGGEAHQNGSGSESIGKSCTQQEHWRTSEATARGPSSMDQIYKERGQGRVESTVEAMVAPT